MKSLKLKKQQWYFLDLEDRILLYNMLQESLDNNHVDYYALNVLSDHIHVVLEYDPAMLADLVQKIKWGVSFQYTWLKNIQEPWEWRKNKIWARWYSMTYIDSEEHFSKAIHYTLNNHIKHEIEDIYPYVNRGL